jgi:hypothetical protein
MPMLKGKWAFLFFLFFFFSKNMFVSKQHDDTKKKALLSLNYFKSSDVSELNLLRYFNIKCRNFSSYNVPIWHNCENCQINFPFYPIYLLRYFRLLVK